VSTEIVDIARLTSRARNIRNWLLENDPGASLGQHLHLNEGSRERIYWHSGYMVALCDVLQFLTGERPNLAVKEDRSAPDTRS
jgi:hypothetical protein